MSKLLLTFYGDDFTGSTDALEQLTLAGVRAALFVTPPTKNQLLHFKNLQAVGVAGMTRSLTLKKMEAELRPAFLRLKKLGARHVHYKVCSTFDSSPQIGSIGRVIDVASKIFPAKFIPLLVAAPALGRFTIFGNHFARFGIGSAGEIHRLDRHPSISKHPVTPMAEADLRIHLAKQTKKKIALFDILKISLPEKEMFAAFKKLLAEKPDVILFDALDETHLKKIGALIDGFANGKQPLFSVGSSGIEMALTAAWKIKRLAKKMAAPAKQILVGSGSCSPVTNGQISWALKDGFAEVPLDAENLADKNSGLEIQRAINVATKFLQNGSSVIVHTTKSGSDQRITKKLKGQTAEILGTALGKVLRGALEKAKVKRLCVAGGDTSSFAARALGIEALEMIAPLTPGAPLCRAFAPNSPADKLEVVFKGGQVGAENYFETVLKGK
jgi:3-oxoisoapionate kinase